MVKIRDPSDFLGLNPGSSKYKLCDLGQVEWHLLFWWLILLSAWHSAMCLLNNNHIFDLFDNSVKKKKTNETYRIREVLAVKRDLVIIV